MDMHEMTLSEFCARAGSSSPTPGGGSTAALVGALAAALAQMVASLTVGKAGYESAQPEMQAVLREGKDIESRLLELMGEDCEAFDAYMRALAMPKNTLDESLARTAALQAAAQTAADVPLSVAQCATAVFPIAQNALSLGNRMAKSDALMATILARAAVRSAVINVRVNLPAFGDPELARRYEARCAALEQGAEMAEIAAISQSEPLAG